METSSFFSRVQLLVSISSATTLAAHALLFWIVDIDFWPYGSWAEEESSSVLGVHDICRATRTISDDEFADTGV